MGTRPEQVGVDWVRTGGGVWAPTIRHHDGIFHVIVTVAMSPRGCVVFTATDPARPWSGGITIDGIGGFDRDLAWDEDGTAYLTFSGSAVRGPRNPKNPERVDRMWHNRTAFLLLKGRLLRFRGCVGGSRDRCWWILNATASNRLLCDRRLVRA